MLRQDPAEQRYPGMAAHLRSCGPCAESWADLLFIKGCFLARFPADIARRATVALSPSVTKRLCLGQASQVPGELPRSRRVC